MKITIFVSGDGEKALYLYDFFKEGNRVSIDSLITDSPSTAIADAFVNDGKRVIILQESTDLNLMAESLRERDVELLVADLSPDHTIPAILEEEFGDRKVVLTSKTKAPLEVIEAVNRINAPVRPEPKEEKRSEAGNDSQPEPKEEIKEWAQALNIDLDDKKPEEPEKPETVNAIPLQEVERAEAASAFKPGPNPFRRPQNEGLSESVEEPMPDTYLVWSIIITILCCTPAGIVAIIYSSIVSSRYFRGNIEGAKRASRLAQIWCIISIVVGIIWMTLYMPLSLLL